MDFFSIELIPADPFSEIRFSGFWAGGLVAVLGVQELWRKERGKGKQDIISQGQTDLNFQKSEGKESVNYTLSKLSLVPKF